jgi:hypothetical protein
MSRKKAKKSASKARQASSLHAQQEYNAEK